MGDAFAPSPEPAVHHGEFDDAQLGLGLSAGHLDGDGIGIWSSGRSMRDGD